MISCLNEQEINNTKIFKLSDRTRNKEGRNIDFAIVDEAHELKTNNIPKSIEQSQSLKENPKFIIITTEGFVVDGYLDEELRRARAIINREADDPASERYLPWLYTQDSESEVWNGNRQNRLWMKSNPTLGTVKKWDYLEEQVALARQSKSDRIFVLSKDFNIKQLESGSWLSFDELQNTTKFDIEELRDCYAVGGVDLSSTTDLTASVLVVKKNSKIYAIPHFFMPKDVLEKRMQEDSVPYDIWVKKGYITLSEGNQNDFTKVTEWFQHMVWDYGIRPLWVGYDPWNSKYWIDEMDEAGFTMEKVRQGVFTLSEPMKQLEADLKNHIVIYDNNPVLKWCLANTQAKVDVNGNIQPCKLNSKYKRIDGAVALIIAYSVLSNYKKDYETMQS